MPMYSNTCNLRNTLFKNQQSIQNRLKIFHLVKLRLRYALDRFNVKNKLIDNHSFSLKKIKVISELSNDALGVEMSILSCNSLKIYIKGIKLDDSTIKLVKSQYASTISDDFLIIKFGDYPFYEQNYRSALNFLDKIKIK